MTTTARCPRCERETPADASFCPACGLDLRDRRALASTGMLATNERLHGRYVIMQKLAQGGQSAVYLATDVFDGGKPRAVKEMSESNLGTAEREKAVNDFMREATMLYRLDHPALAKVYETFVEHQKHYLVMEYVRGHNLEDELISKGRPLEWERVTDWGIALCGVLTYLHNLTPPIIYRDLKPANVMLTPEGSIKLIDFGIARWLHPMRTRDTAQLGTDGYAPLEQYSARSETRSDLYALGASLYHLLTGRVPEAAPMRIAGRPFAPIRSINHSVPESLERVVHQALSLQPQDRFANADQMRQALEWARRSAMMANPSGRIRAAPTPAPLGRVSAPSLPPLAKPTPKPAPAPRVTSTTQPKLYIWPLRLDAGFIEPNDTALLALEVANRGGGALTGTTETNMACLTVEPERVTPDLTALQVRVDTQGLQSGPYTCHLAVRTNGGDQIVPVRFVVRPTTSPMAGPDTRR